MKLTQTEAQVVAIFLDGETHFGYELMKVMEWPSGKLYPQLARLEAKGVIKRLAPVAGPSGPKRVPYLISANVAASAASEVARLRRSLFPRPRLASKIKGAVVQP